MGSRRGHSSGGLQQQQDVLVHEDVDLQAEVQRCDTRPTDATKAGPLRPTMHTRTRARCELQLSPRSLGVLRSLCAPAERGRAPDEEMAPDADLPHGVASVRFRAVRGCASRLVSRRLCLSLAQHDVLASRREHECASQQTEAAAAAAQRDAVTSQLQQERAARQTVRTCAVADTEKRERETPLLAQDAQDAGGDTEHRAKSKEKRENSFARRCCGIGLPLFRARLNCGTPLCERSRKKSSAPSRLPYRRSLARLVAQLVARAVARGRGLRQRLRP